MAIVGPPILPLSEDKLQEEMDAELQWRRQRDMRPMFVWGGLVSNLTGPALKKYVFPAEARLSCFEEGFVCAAYLKAFFTLLFHYNKNLDLPTFEYAFKMISLFSAHCNGQSMHKQFSAAEAAKLLVDHSDFNDALYVSQTAEDRIYASTPDNLEALKQETELLEDLVKKLDVVPVENNVHHVTYRWTELVLIADPVIHKSMGVCDKCWEEFSYTLMVSNSCLTYSDMKGRGNAVFAVPMTEQKALEVLQTFVDTAPPSVKCVKGTKSVDVNGELDVILQFLTGLVCKA